MTPEEQRIAIAEACGWGKYGDIYYNHDDGKKVQWWIKNGMIDPVPHVPDYYNDLNAIHEAVEVLDATQYAKFAELLGIAHPDYCISVIDDKNPTEDFWYETSKLVNATAHQRCEAFLKAIGKYKE